MTFTPTLHLAGLIDGRRGVGGLIGVVFISYVFVFEVTKVTKKMGLRVLKKTISKPAKDGL